MRSILRYVGLWLTLLAVSYSVAESQSSLPATVGETLSGKTMVLAEAVRGHTAVLVVGFSREAGDGCSSWVKAIHADPAMAGVEVYPAAMLEQAPAFVRGMIKSGMRKGLSPQEQDRFVVFTKDEKLWRAYFSVTDEKVPYVVFLNSDGKMLWRGHGPAADFEAQLRAAKP